jgi:hypothetical protein
VSCAQTASGGHEHDDLIARFFGGGRPDWQSADGQKVASLAMEYCCKRRRRYRDILDAHKLDDLCQMMMVKLINFGQKGKKIEADTYLRFLSLCRTTICRLFVDIVRKTEPCFLNHQGQMSAHGNLSAGAKRHLSDTRSVWQRRVEDSECGRKIMERIRRDCPQHAKVLELEAQLTVQEMMERLHLSRDALYKRISRARTAFRKIYEEFESEK